MLRHLRFVPALVLASAVLAQPVAAPPAPQTAVAPADRAAAVRELVRREVEKQQIVGLSVAVARNGAIVVEEHAGFEDREAAIPAGPSTMYRWASISKPVTAVAAMQQVEAGRLDLDADVRSFVPEFDEKPFIITPRQLLSHQGGIVHYNNGKVIAQPRPQTPENPYEDVVVAIGTFDASPLINEPGTKYSYTTHGYLLLGAAVERAAGEKFWPVVRERIAKPAGMTTFQPDYQWVKIDHRAVGYRKARNGDVVRSTDTDVSWKLAGGGFISNTADVARFGIALMENSLVSAESFAAMSTKQKLKDGTETDYGLGLNIGIVNRQHAVWHSGSQEKASTYLLMIPRERLCVAVMCNTEGTALADLTRRILRTWMTTNSTDAPADAEP